MCTSFEGMKRLVAERNRSATQSLVERKLAWTRAINLINVPAGGLECFTAEGNGVLGESAGQVLVESTVYDVREADFVSLLFNGERVYGRFHLFILTRRPAYGA